MANAFNILDRDARPRWVKVTKTYADLAAAALTNDIEAYSIPAGSAVHAVILKPTTAFSGGAIATYTVSAGISGSLAKYAAAFDVAQAPGGGVFAIPAISGLTVESFTAATSLRIAAISTVGNLSAATQGSVDVYILTSQLP
jgi:hypothetical protein